MHRKISQRGHVVTHSPNCFNEYKTEDNKCHKGYEYYISEPSRILYVYDGKDVVLSRELYKEDSGTLDAWARYFIQGLINSLQSA